MIFTDSASLNCDRRNSSVRSQFASDHKEGRGLWLCLLLKLHVELIKMDKERLGKATNLFRQQFLNPLLRIVSALSSDQHVDIADIGCRTEQSFNKNAAQETSSSSHKDPLVGVKLGHGLAIAARILVEGPHLWIRDHRIFRCVVEVSHGAVNVFAYDAATHLNGPGPLITVLYDCQLS